MYKVVKFDFLGETKYVLYDTLFGIPFSEVTFSIIFEYYDNLIYTKQKVLWVSEEMAIKAGEHMSQRVVDFQGYSIRPCFSYNLNTKGYTDLRYFVCSNSVGLKEINNTKVKTYKTIEDAKKSIINEEKYNVYLYG